MGIVLGAFALPDGLVWSDEFAWQPVRQVVTPTLSGAAVVEEWSYPAARPITLEGGRSGRTSWAWMARADALALRDALDVPGATFTLTLHDGRSFQVMPRRDGSAPLDAVPLPVYGERAPANPGEDHWYVINRIQLMTVEE